MICLEDRKKETKKLPPTYRKEPAGRGLTSPSLLCLVLEGVGHKHVKGFRRGDQPSGLPWDGVVSWDTGLSVLNPGQAGMVTHPTSGEKHFLELNSSIVK